MEESERKRSAQSESEHYLWEKLSRLRDHPFATAVLLAFFIKLFYQTIVFFSPLIISTMLCVLAFIRLGPLLEQARKENPIPEAPEAEEYRGFKTKKQKQLRWNVNGLNEVMGALEELYSMVLSAAEQAKDSGVVKEISNRCEELVKTLRELCRAFQEMIADNPVLSKFPDKRTIIRKACNVGDMLGVDLRPPITTFSTVIDDILSEEPVDFAKEPEPAAQIPTRPVSFVENCVRISEEDEDENSVQYVEEQDYVFDDDEGTGKKHFYTDDLIEEVSNVQEQEDTGRKHFHTDDLIEEDSDVQEQEYSGRKHFNTDDLIEEVSDVQEQEDSGRKHFLTDDLIEEDSDVQEQEDSGRKHFNTDDLIEEVSNVQEQEDSGRKHFLTDDLIGEDSDVHSGRKHFSTDSDLDPYMYLFAESPSTFEEADDDEDCLPPAFRRGLDSPSWLFPARHISIRRRHFLSDLLFLPALLRASKRCFMACFRYRIPNQRTRFMGF